jgi:DNA-binding PadR family transcriptional regulator
MDEIPRLSGKERVVLDLLINHREMYGLEMVKAAPTDLKRGTVYVLLGRMAGKGYVDSRQEKSEREPGMPRRVFFITAEGQRVLRADAAGRAAYSAGLSEAIA